MVSKLRIIWKQTVVQQAEAVVRTFQQAGFERPHMWLAELQAMKHEQQSLATGAFPDNR